jgi:probable HAF family extracellular repeat protein
MISAGTKALACASMCGAFSLACLQPSDAGTTYRITDLSAPPNQAVGFTALNNSGQLTGSYTPSGSSASHVFLYNNGTITDLGTNGGTFSAGVSINVNGQIGANAGVGPTQQPNVHAFIISGAAFTDLGSLLPGLLSEAASINGTGQVTGYSFTTNSGNQTIDEQSRHAFLYTNGMMTDLGTLQNAGYSYGTGVNDAGQVIGGSYVGVPAGALPGFYEHAFIYNNGAMTDLTPPGMLLSWAYAINNAGDIVGQLATDTPIGGGAIQETIQAAIYSNGVWTNIGQSVAVENGTSTATALNNVGQVVGATTAGPFLYSSGALLNLSDLIDPTNPLASTVTLQTPKAINDNGWILVPSRLATDTNNIHYLLLTPQTLIFDPGSLNFGAQGALPIGTESPTQTFTVTNSGASAVPLSGISVTGDFSATNNCPASLVSGASCTFTVGFTPAAINTRTGDVTVTAAGLVYVVALTGSGKIVLSMNASPASDTVGMPTTIMWTGSPGTTCTASGGAAGDGWTGTFASSGSTAVTESSAGTFTYALSCSESGTTVKAQTVVTTTMPTVTAPASKGGGGSIDLYSLLFLAGILAMKTLRLRATRNGGAWYAATSSARRGLKSKRSG